MISEEQTKQILDSDEVMIYFMSDGCGSFIWRMARDMSHGRLPADSISDITEDIENIRELQKFAIDSLTRFGINIDNLVDDGNSEYWKWYRFWDNWKKGLSDEDWNIVNGLMTKEESIKDYLPTNTWRD